MRAGSGRGLEGLGGRGGDKGEMKRVGGGFGEAKHDGTCGEILAGRGVDSGLSQGHVGGPRAQIGVEEAGIDLGGEG